MSGKKNSANAGIFSRAKTQPEPWDKPEELTVEGGLYEPFGSRQEATGMLLIPKKRSPPLQSREVSAECICGGTSGYEVGTRDGHRRVDCAYCGRFLLFSKWSGTDASVSD